MADFPALMEPVARQLLGEPNEFLSKSSELRYGTNGSMSVKLKGGTWYDHEAGVGGGVLDLIAHKTGCNGHAQARCWLRDEGYVTEDAESPRRSGKSKKIIATYDYRDAHGRLAFQVCRFEPKSFQQRRPDGKGGWIWNVKDIETVPYNLPAVLSAESAVFIVEGEKDVDRLSEIGVTATTNPGGAKKWPDHFSRYFRGRFVNILPDNDKAGRAHALIVAAKLHGVAKEVCIVELPGLPAKGDISDWLDAGNTREDLITLLAAAPEWTPDAAEKADHAVEAHSQKSGEILIAARLDETAVVGALLQNPNEDNVALAFAEKYRDQYPCVSKRPQGHRGP